MVAADETDPPFRNKISSMRWLFIRITDQGQNIILGGQRILTDTVTEILLQLTKASSQAHGSRQTLQNPLGNVFEKATIYGAPTLPVHHICKYVNHIVSFFGGGKHHMHRGLRNPPRQLPQVQPNFSCEY